MNERGGKIDHPSGLAGKFMEKTIHIFHHEQILKTIQQKAAEKNLNTC